MRLGTCYRVELLRRRGLHRCKGRVLDVGGLDGAWAATLDAGVRFVVDVAPAPAHNGIRYVAGDGLALPFADASFDTAFALDVVEHVDDEGAFLGELARVLRPGGRLVLTTPNSDIRVLPGRLQRVVDRAWGHHRVPGFSPAAIAAAAEEAGFARLEIEPLRALAFRLSFVPLRALWQVPGPLGAALARAAAFIDARLPAGERGFLLVRATVAG